MRMLLITLTATVALLAGGIFAVSQNSSSAVSAPYSAPSPFAARGLYVDPNSWAAWGMVAYPSTAKQVKVIATTPQARWFGDELTGAPLSASVNNYVSGASQAGKLPVLVTYAIPHRDCGGYSSGGAANASSYAAWIRAFRAGIGRRPAVVILEPDAVTSADCLPAAGQQERLAMLQDAVNQLTSDSTTSVYIDGGHSRWLSASDLATRLRMVGVAKTRGFSLNVSNFFSTSEETQYGETVSKLLGGARYVVDTSRNGNGPAPDAPLNWCNPSGRALGSAPSAITGAQHADALLWIKRPGESDGDCGRGDPVSGHWFNSYAVALVNNAGR